MRRGRMFGTLLPKRWAATFFLIRKGLQKLRSVLDRIQRGERAFI